MGAQLNSAQIRMLYELELARARLDAALRAVHHLLVINPGDTDANNRLEAQSILLQEEIDEIDAQTTAVRASAGTIRLPTDEEVKEIETRSSQVDNLIRNARTVDDTVDFVIAAVNLANKVQTVGKDTVKPSGKKT